MAWRSAAIRRPLSIMKPLAVGVTAKRRDAVDAEQAVGQRPLEVPAPVNRKSAVSVVQPGGPSNRCAAQRSVSRPDSTLGWRNDAPAARRCACRGSRWCVRCFQPPANVVIQRRGLGTAGRAADADGWRLDRLSATSARRRQSSGSDWPRAEGPLRAVCDCRWSASAGCDPASSARVAGQASFFRRRAMNPTAASPASISA